MPKVGVWLHHVWFVSYSITGPVKSLKMLQVKYKDVSLVTVMHETEGKTTIG